MLLCCLWLWLQSWCYQMVQTILQSQSEVAQSCPTLCDPTNCSLAGFSIHGILQARALEWVASPFSRGSSQPRDGTQVSHIAGRRFALWATREAHTIIKSSGENPLQPPRRLGKRDLPCCQREAGVSQEKPLLPQSSQALLRVKGQPLLPLQHQKPKR